MSSSFADVTSHGRHHAAQHRSRHANVCPKSTATQTKPLVQPPPQLQSVSDAAAGRSGPVAAHHTAATVPARERVIQFQQHLPTLSNSSGSAQSQPVPDAKRCRRQDHSASRKPKRSVVDEIERFRCYVDIIIFRNVFEKPGACIALYLFKSFKLNFLRFL